MTDEEKKELYEMLPSVPIKLREWVDKQFNWRRTHFFTRKQGNLILECCHCGHKWTVENSSHVESLIADKAHVRCPECKQMGHMVSKKNRKAPLCDDIDIWYGQKLTNSGYILRFFRPILKAVPDKEEPYEVLELEERMRYWFPVGMNEKLYKEFYHVWGADGGTWNNTYCFSTMGYMNNSPSHGFIHPDTYRNMKGTVMAYSMTKEALIIPRIASRFNIADWQQAYIKNPWFEAMIKLNLSEIAYDKMFWGLHGMRTNGRAKTPWDYLKIEKRRMKELSQTPSGSQVGALRVYRLEKMIGDLGDLASDLIQYRLSEKDFKELIGYSTPEKIVNYLRKQTGTDKGAWAREYLDYLRMKKKLGYDMTDSIVLFPKDLKEAHNKAVIETDEIAAEERRAEAEENFKEIRTRFKEADEVYHCESGTFIIRPAKSASEIVDEGRYLHHCVGGDDYLSKHNDKESIICFLRPKEEPEKPYITVELINGKVEQWHGYLNEKPDEKKVDRWLKRYIKALDPVKVRREAKSRTKQHKTAI